VELVAGYFWGWKGKRARSVGKEFAILIAVHVSAAEINCPYRIQEERLRTILNHYQLTMRDVFTVSRSPDLNAEVEKVYRSFRSDKPRACDIAWKNFGPGAPFGGLLQPR
jgi:hypothetical protein